MNLPCLVIVIGPNVSWHNLHRSKFISEFKCINYKYNVLYGGVFTRIHFLASNLPPNYNPIN